MKMGFVAVALLATANSVHGATAPLDGLPLPASRAEFLKRFPNAALLFEKKAPVRETLAVLRPDVQRVDGQAVESVMQTFVDDQACAISIGFVDMTQERADHLVGALKRRHKQMLREHKASSEWQVVFMSDENARIAIAQSRDNEAAPVKVAVVYAVVLKSCPIEVAKDHQVIPPLAP